MTGIEVIGTGHWGKNHARVYKSKEGVADSAIICDIGLTHVLELENTLFIQGDSK